MSREIASVWHAAGGKDGRLGLAVGNQCQLAGGEAVYFRRGCLWRGYESGGVVVESHLSPPLMGQPALIKRSNASLPDMAAWLTSSIEALATPSGANLAPLQQVLQMIWHDRLMLRPVLPAGHLRHLVPLAARSTDIFDDTRASLARPLPLSMNVAHSSQLKNRTLYDIVLNSPDGEDLTVASHAVYASDSWDRFGIIHATDLHVARRDDVIDARLKNAVAAAGEASNTYVNYNNGVRDLIRYANRLHRLGLADMILMTGDLVDYLYERDDTLLNISGDVTTGGGNFEYFFNLMLGKHERPGGPATGRAPDDELQIPFFTTLGNHDYRRGRYEFVADVEVDVGISVSEPLPNFTDHNFLECEALRLQPQGRKVVLDTDSQRAHDMLDVNPSKERYDPARIPALRFYRREIASDPTGSYVIGGSNGVQDIGPHRIIMLNTLWDAGIPDDDDFDFIKCKGPHIPFVDCSEDMRMLLNGSPNQVGFNKAAFDLLSAELAHAPQDGVIIVGLHGPPLNPAGSEYPHYFRETEHAQADPVETLKFLVRNGAMTSQSCSLQVLTLPPKACVTASYKGWGEAIGQPYFRYGPIGPYVDYSVARSDGRADEFLSLCVDKQVDMVLFGHVHRRVEFRVKRHSDEHLRYYMDFYTENPKVYYPSKMNGFADPVKIKVVPGADPLAAPKSATNPQEPLWPAFKQLEVPPYASPLNEASDVKAWWDNHRPLLVQTASLGPIDISQRLPRENCGGSSVYPGPSFQGFRLISVIDNRIAKVHYVTLDDLRAHKFWLPLEKELLAFDTGAIEITAVKFGGTGGIHICPPLQPNCNPGPDLEIVKIKGKCWFLTHQESGETYEICDDDHSGTAKGHGLKAGQYELVPYVQGIVMDGQREIAIVRARKTTKTEVRRQDWGRSVFPPCQGSTSDRDNCGRCDNQCWNLDKMESAPCDDGLCHCDGNAAVRCRAPEPGGALPTIVPMLSICCNRPQEECLAAVASTEIAGVKTDDEGWTCRLLK